MSEPALHLDRCPACFSPGLKPWFSKATAEGRYELCSCSGCGSAFVNPRPSLEQIQNFYARTSYRAQESESPQSRWDRLLAEEKNYPNTTLDAERMADRCRRFARGDDFLDVGAGDGFFSRAARARSFRVHALEPSPAGRRVFALMNGFEPEPALLDLDFARRHPAAFDVVLLSQVLEHVSDVEETLAVLGRVLKADGIVAVAVPHFRSWSSRLQGRNDMFITPPEHLNFFTAPGLLRLFERQGYRRLGLETISRFNPARIGSRLPFPILRPAAIALLKLALKAADRMDRGLYLNLYVQKEPPAHD
jgi:SAM-dependent methyltransferase